MKIEKWCAETRNEEVLGDFLDAGLLFLMLFLSDDYIKGFKSSEPEVENACT